LELSLLERFIGHESPFIEHGNKLVIVQKNIVVLIKHIPENEERFGSTRDYLKILLEGANAKLDYLSEMSRRRAMRDETAVDVIVEAEEALHNIQENQKQHKQKSINLLDEMTLRVEESFVSMGLTDAQEEELLLILSDTSVKALNHFELGLKLDEKIVDIVNSLSTIARY